MWAPTGCCRITSALTTSVTRFTSAWMAAPTIAFGPASIIASAASLTSASGAASAGAASLALASSWSRVFGGGVARGPRVGSRRGRRGSELPGPLLVTLVRRRGRRRLRRRRWRWLGIRREHLDRDRRLAFHVVDLEPVRKLDRKEKIVRDEREHDERPERPEPTAARPEPLGAAALATALALALTRRGRVRSSGRRLRRAVSERSALGLTLEHVPS